MLLLYLLNTIQYPSSILRYKKMYEFLEGLNNFLGAEQYDELSNIIQNVTLALISILIPIAIVILTEAFQKRDGIKVTSKAENEPKSEFPLEYAKLDLHVILDCVFNVKSVIIAIIVIFTPLFFWKFEHLRLLEIFIVTIGIYFLLRIIIDVCCWIRGDVFKFRLRYLAKVKKPKDVQAVWDSVWASDMDRFDEKRFFSIFSEKIDDLMEK